MILDDTTLPIVRMHYDQPVPEGGEGAFETFDRLLALEKPFVMIALGAGQHQENYDQLKQVSLWRKRNSDALHRFVIAMVYVEPQAANRFFERARADTYEKFWGYPMLVVAGEDEAAEIAGRLLAGEAASGIIVDEPYVPTGR